MKIIFFIIFLLNIAYANAAPKLYYEKGVAEDKVKLQLIIKEKKKNKKVKQITDMILTLGSKGLSGITKDGGYCKKFDRYTSSYKKVKLMESIFYIASHDKCLKNIESYTNKSDNISDVYFTFEKYFGTDDVRLVGMWDFLGGGVADFLDKSENKFIGLSKVNVKTGESMIIQAYPLILYEPNDLSNKKFYEMLDELVDNDSDDQTVMKKITDYLFALSMKELLSLYMADQEIKDIYKNKDYLYVCDKIKTAGNKFTQINSGYAIIDTNQIQNIDFILKEQKISFDRYTASNFFNSSDFPQKLNKVFLECNGTDLFKINVQSRN